MNSLSIITALIAGIGSFFAPCVLPLLPAYVGYVTGISVKKSRIEMIRVMLMYIAGFSLIFVLLGASAGGIGSLLREHTRPLQFVGGIAMVIFGLEFVGLLNLRLLSINSSPKLPKWTNSFEYFRSFFIGILFAITWTPCVGPILGGILSLAAASATSANGAVLLLAYSLGISVPFVLVSLTLSSAPFYLRKYRKTFNSLSKFAGFILIVFGLLLVTDTYKYLNSILFDIAYQFGWQIR